MDLSQESQYTFNHNAHLARTRTLVAGATLTAEDSGCTIFLGSATGGAIVLPPPKLGLNFRFIVGVADITTDWTINTSSTGVYFWGGVSRVLTGSNPGIGTGTEDQITFEADTGAVGGDMLEVICNGTNWLITGVAVTAVGIAVE